MKMNDKHIVKAEVSKDFKLQGTLNDSVLMVAKITM